MNLVDVWSFHVHKQGFATSYHYVKENQFRNTCFVSLSIVLDRLKLLDDFILRSYAPHEASNI